VRQLGIEKKLKVKSLKLKKSLVGARLIPPSLHFGGQASDLSAWMPG